MRASTSSFTHTSQARVRADALARLVQPTDARARHHVRASRAHPPPPQHRLERPPTHAHALLQKRAAVHLVPVRELEQTQRLEHLTHRLRVRVVAIALAPPKLEKRAV
eukprot:29974-Pelagococcus_subviridis.AAC.8